MFSAGMVPLLLCTAQAQTKVWINTFDSAAEVSASGKNWNNWFGTAYYQALWDPSDATNNPSSGSLLLQAFYPDSGIGGCCGPQFVLYNQNNGINPSLVGNGGNPASALATNVEFDVRFSNVPPEPNHPIWAVTNATSTNWPTIEVGTRGTDFGQHDFGTFTLPVDNTNWNHISIPIPPNAVWTNIPNIFFKHFSGTASGWVVMYVDNIVFTTAAVPIIPPAMAIQQAKPALRIFSGPSQFNRDQLLAVDTNQSWVGGSYPVSYNFTISAYDVNPPINEFHVFLIPVNYVQGGGLNAFTDFSTALNDLRLQIIGGAAGTPTVTCNLAWKTNQVNANPTNIVANLTNGTMLGAWKLQFNNATDGIITPPGGTATPFTLPSDVSAQFANPLAFFIGLQPNPTTAIGQHLDLKSVQTVGVASPGVPINTDFANGLDTNIWSLAATATTTFLSPVTNTSSWWVSSAYPDYGAVLATAPSVLGPWKTPHYYTGYDTNGYYEQNVGPATWRLIPSAALPTVDALSNSVKSSSAFFRVQSPAPAE